MQKIDGIQPQTQSASATEMQTKFMWGVTLYQQGRLAEAERVVEEVLQRQKKNFSALHFLGIIACQTKRLERGVELIKKAIKLNPKVAGFYSDLGNALRDLSRPEEALASFDKALALEKTLAYAWHGRGNALYDLKRYDEALHAYQQAGTLEPSLANVWVGCGNVLTDLKRYEEALVVYDKALRFNPNLAEAWHGRGNVLNKLKRHEEAAESFSKLLNVNQQYPFAKGWMLYQKLLVCDWTDVSHAVAEIEADIIAGKLSAEPFGFQGVASSEQSLMACAKLYNETRFPSNIQTVNIRPSRDKHKVHIGYLCGEFRDQATSHLLVGVLEEHDNAQFGIYAFDNGWDDRSKTRQRINESVRNIIDIRRLGDQSTVAAIRQNQIDILVNLNGYFGEERTQVFARRPAPIQVNYLGFPGTLGAKYIDYLIADRHVIPAGHEQFYTEKVVYLPNSYQANDRKKEIGTHNFSRVECELPENGFVFCCFNNSYKIMPNIFDRWMRLLQQVNNSVLWLIEDNPGATKNLKKEAVARGVSAERLVFAKRMPLADHLARHRLADLFLDTLPYNAHTTASDALWANLPVLTCVGETFPGRVAASLLNAIGLPELITTSIDAYEQMAIDLATHPERLAAIKRKLAENRLKTPLFDTRLFTKHIEAAYIAMYERHKTGLVPDHIVIAS